MNKGGMFLRWNFAGCVFWGCFWEIRGCFWTFLDAFGREAGAEHTHLGQILVAC